MIQRILNWFFKSEPLRHKKILDVIPSEPDPSDVLYKLAEDNDLPDIIDLSDRGQGVKYQGSAGSCGSHAICSSIEKQMYGSNQLDSMGLSERFHYYVVRQEQYQNTFPLDSGQSIRNGLLVAKNVGISSKWQEVYVPIVKIKR